MFFSNSNLVRKAHNSHLTKKLQADNIENIAQELLKQTDQEIKLLTDIKNTFHKIKNIVSNMIPIDDWYRYDQIKSTIASTIYYIPLCIAWYITKQGEPLLAVRIYELQNTLKQYSNGSIPRYTQEKLIAEINQTIDTLSSRISEWERLRDQHEYARTRTCTML